MTVKKIVFALLALTNGLVFANTRNAPHAPINHCYHWIDQASNSYLSFKYNYAKSHGNELTFHTTPGTSNGSVAGPGLYCAKSPSGSYSYGDRLIRIDFVEDVVLYDAISGIKYCGQNGVTSQNDSECASKQWDLKFYSGGGRGNRAWYVIQNPDAIYTWSANSDQLVSDLNASISINGSDFKRHAEKTIQAMQQEVYAIGSRTFVNEKARRSIVKIALTDPSELDSLPPLSVVSRLAKAKDDDRLPEDIRNDIYRRFLALALKSNEIPYGDYEDALRMDKKVEAAFIEISKMAIKRNSQANATVILNAAANYSEISESISDAKYQDLVVTALSHPAAAVELSNAALAKDQKIRALVRQRMNQIKNSQEAKKLASALDGLLDNYYSGAERNSQKSQWIKSIYQTNGDVKLVINGKDAYFLNLNGGNTVDQCSTLVELAGLTGAIEIKKGPNSLKTGQFTYDKQENIGRCKIVAALADELMSLEDNEKVSFALTGTIEGQEYVFIGDDVDDMDEQCSATYDALSSKQVDDIYWSVNGTRPARLYNGSSYWRTKSEVCSQIKNAAAHLLPDRLTEQWKNEAKSSDPAFVVTGRFEKQNFFFFGAYLEDIEDKCDRFYARVRNKNSIDDIYYSVNGRSERVVSDTRKGFGTKSLLCSALANDLAGDLPSKLDSQWRAQAKAQNASYIVEGSSEIKWKFFLYGENLDEIKARCEIYYANRHRPPTSQMKVWVNDSSSELIETQSEWFDKVSFCQSMANGLRDDIPSKAVVEMRAGAKNTKASYIIEGDFEGTEYLFYGDTVEDINKQCVAFYPSIIYNTSLDSMSYTINSQRTKYVQNSGFWQNASELCSALSTHLIGRGVSRKFELEAKIANAKRRSEAGSTGALVQIEGELGSNGLPFFFYGSDYGDIKTQCSGFQSKLPQNEFFSTMKGRVLNGDSFLMRTDGSTTNRMFCAVLETQIKSKVQKAMNSKAGKNFAAAIKNYYNDYPEALSSDAPLMAIINGDDYLIIKAKTHKEALDQCEEQQDRGRFSLSGDLRAKIGTYEIPLSPYIGQRTCEGIVAAIGPNLKSKKALDHEEQYALRRAEFSFEVKVNHANIRLFGDSVQQMEDQCLDIYARGSEGLRANFEISWRYVEENRTGEFRLRNSEAREVCIELSEAARKATKKGILGFFGRTFGN